jgi:hypothetical protein
LQVPSCRFQVENCNTLETWDLELGTRNLAILSLLNSTTRADMNIYATNAANCWSAVRLLWLLIAAIIAQSEKTEEQGFEFFGQAGKAMAEGRAPRSLQPGSDRFPFLPSYT